jgi:hypothetical protein
MFESELVLSPLHFLAINLDCHHYSGEKELVLKKQYLLPDMAPFSQTSPFANVALGWSVEGIFCTVYSEISVSEVYFPDFQRGDCVELFIDTRDLKGSKFPTKFCHHFCFLPEPVVMEGEEIQGMEVTHFRGEETHPLADPSLFYVECEKHKKGYILKIFIPSTALFGYDPSQYDRLGFTYRINRNNRPAQYFSCSGQEVAIELHPSLWSSLKLIK